MCHELTINSDTQKFKAAEGSLDLHEAAHKRNMKQIDQGFYGMHLESWVPLPPYPIQPLGSDLPIQNQNNHKKISQHTTKIKLRLKECQGIPLTTGQGQKECFTKGTTEFMIERHLGTSNDAMGSQEGRLISAEGSSEEIEDQSNPS
jgi:hypothetical protein